MKPISVIFHAVVYDLAWLAAILFAARNNGTLSTLIVLITFLLQVLWQYKIDKRVKGLWCMAAIFLVMGTFADTFLLQSGMIVFSANPFSQFSPPWMSALWLSFAITFYSTLSFLFKQYVLVGVLSFLGFTMAYSFGVIFQAASLPYGFKSVGVVGIIWAIFLPLSLRLYNSLISD